LVTSAALARDPGDDFQRFDIGRVLLRGVSRQTALHANGKRMADGEWRMANGGWRMAEGF
jgi:hypothetical protein